MEIEITSGTDGKYEVRTNTGALLIVPSRLEADAVAIGMQAGYNAAIEKLGRCTITNNAR
jgi:hypothetical protein